MDSNAAELEASAPGGFSGKIRLRDSLDARAWLVFILVIMQGVLIYVVIGQESDRERRYSGTTAILSEIMAQIKSNSGEHGGIITNQRLIIESQKQVASEQRIQTYVLTLDEKQRKGLNLQEPEGLRNRR